MSPQKGDVCRISLGGTKAESELGKKQYRRILEELAYGAMH